MIMKEIDRNELKELIRELIREVIKEECINIYNEQLKECKVELHNFAKRLIKTI